MAEFLLALADFDRRRGFEPLGFASTFAFLLAELGLSRAATHWRLSAARLLLLFPEVIEPLRDGRLCLTTVADLAKVLTEENRAEVMPRFFGASSPKARELVAELLPRPAPPLRTVVTPVKWSTVAPTPTLLLAVRTVAAANVAAPTHEANDGVRAPELQMTHPARGMQYRPEIEPLTTDLRRLAVTVSKRFLTKLDAAREGLSHALPRATTEQVLEAALDLLLEKQARARGQVKRPRKTTPIAAPAEPPTATPAAAPPAPEPRHHRLGPREHLPAADRRAVWERDQARCTWPLDGGGVCGSTHRLEIDHRDPRGLGGQPELGNLRLLCERHNKLAARLAYGERWMGRYACARVR